ncbi:MAG: hypothetical protein AAB400_05055 [Patescibacteria group bacterium]
MARFGPGGTAEKAAPPAVEAAKSQEAKAESKEKSLSDVGRERAERAQATVSKGVEAVKGAVGKGLSFLKEKGMALLAIDVAAARAGKATGEFIKKDAAKTLERAQAAGQKAAEVGKAAAGAVKEDWDQTKGDIKAVGAAAKAGAESAGRFAVGVGKGAVEAGKTAVEVGIIAGAVGAEVGKFAARKAGEGVEAAAGFAAKKIEQTMDGAQKRYEAISGALSRLEQQTRTNIAGARDRFNGKINSMREQALNSAVDAINKGIEAQQNLQTAIDQGRKAAGVKMFEFIKRHNEQKLDALQAKFEKAQRKVSLSNNMIELLSR